MRSFMSMCMVVSSIGLSYVFLSSVYISVAVLSLCLYFLANKRCHKVLLQIIDFNGIFF